MGMATCLDEMPNKPKILLLENVLGLLSTNGGDNYRALHMSLVERGYRCGANRIKCISFCAAVKTEGFLS